MQDQTILKHMYIIYVDFLLSLGLTPLNKKAAPIDFPLPNEIIEIVMAFLSSSDLIVLAAVGTERLKNYSFIFLETKIHGKYSFCENVKCHILLL